MDRCCVISEECWIPEAVRAPPDESWKVVWSVRVAAGRKPAVSGKLS